MYLFIVSFHVILLKQSSRNVACSTHQAVGKNSLLYCHYTRDKMLLVYLNLYFFDYDSVHFSPSVVSDSLRPHGLQHTRPPCPSSTPRVYSNSCPLSRWCHPTISSSIVPFSSHLQYFPVSGSLQMSQLFASGVQIIGVSASTPVLPMNIQGWFPLGWTGRISLQFKRTLKSLLQHHSSKASILSLQSNSHMHTWLLEKP